MVNKYSNCITKKFRGYVQDCFNLHHCWRVNKKPAKANKAVAGSVKKI